MGMTQHGGLLFQQMGRLVTGLVSAVVVAGLAVRTILG